MSAIGEWFGYYSAIFNYMEKTYGREELERYLDYIAKVPNCDISAQYREGGLDVIRARYEKTSVWTVMRIQSAVCVTERVFRCRCAARRISTHRRLHIRPARSQSASATAASGSIPASCAKLDMH